jgi:hypothetical protein
MKRSLIIVLGLLLISITGSFAQDPNSAIDLDYVSDPVFLGITVGYNRVMHSVTLPSFDEQGTLCPKFENGSDNGFWAGITYEHFFGDLSNSNMSLIFRALYSSYPSYLEVGGEEYPTQVRYYNDLGELVDQKIVYSSTMNTQTIKYDVVSLEVSYKIKPIDGINLGITVTPTFDYALTKTYDQRFELIEPQNAQFKVDPEFVAKGYKYTNNDRTIIINSGDIPNSSAFRVGLKAGIQYEINIPGGFYIVPALYYNFGITNLTSNNDWRVSALQIGIDIRKPIRF